jgi:hypothetical protein
MVDLSVFHPVRPPWFHWLNSRIQDRFNSFRISRSLQAPDCARNGNILRWLMAGTDPKGSETQI